VTVPEGDDRDAPERVGAYDGVAAAEHYPPAVDRVTGLVSLRFIRTALRRRKWLWRAIALAGLLTGLGIYVAFPPADQASTTILLTQMPGGSPGPVALLKPAGAMQDDVVMLQSRTVAERATRELGLNQSVDSFLAAETVTPITDRILTVTVSAPSSSAAVSRANALAAEFLKFRAQQLQAQQHLMFAADSQQITEASQHVASLASQVASVLGQPKSPARQAMLKELRARLGRANTTLTVAQSAFPNYQVTAASAIEGSEVLDPAAPVPRLPRSVNTGMRLPIRYAITGLIPGLVLGLGLVIVLELASDRLRRREDVARALEAPVRLSVASVPAGRGRAGAGSGDVQRVVAHLRGNLPGSSRGAAALAVVAVDNAQAAAVPLVSLAVSCAQEGRTVVVADLSGGAHAAHLLSAGDPGVRTVTADGAHLVVAVPDRDDVVPVGPLHRVTAQGQSTRGSEEMAAAYASADLLLTLVSLDPSLGGEHLVTWATDAVVVVTAGQSSWTRLHAVGEMIRLAGTRLASAVLLGADKTDESLGTPPKPSPPYPVRVEAGRTGRSRGTRDTPSPRSPVRVGAGSTGRSRGTMQTPSTPTPAEPGVPLPDSPASTHRSSRSRASRGLRSGVRGERT
jgi:capsular polysaccharide biosynthesis protein